MCTSSRRDDHPTGDPLHSNSLPSGAAEVYLLGSYSMCAGPQTAKDWNTDGDRLLKQDDAWMDPPQKRES